MKIRPLQILLADDDPDDREIFQGSLQETSVVAELTMFNSCERLMTYLIENKLQLPDFLFLDLNMPLQNGVECLKKIKQNNDLSTLKIIILSVLMYPPIIEEVYRHGALYFIKKPNSYKDLSRMLEKVLSLPEEKISVQPPIEDFFLEAA